MKLIAELQREDNKNLITLNAMLLLYEIQITIRNENRFSENTIDLTRYVKTQAFVAQLKLKMIRQAELQAGVCQEMTGDAPNLFKMFSDAQLAHATKIHLDVKINQMLHFIPEYFLQPLLICGHYHLTLNYSLNEYNKYLKLYTKIFQKYEKFFRGDELSETTFYQDNNVLFVLSGQKSDLGKIVYCTKTVESLCGGELRNYMGLKISTAIAPPRLESFYEAFFKSCIESGDKSLFNKVIRSYITHKEGHIVEMEYYMDIHPFVTQGFFISLIIRPTLNHKEFILIHENGDIEGVSRLIGNRLRILTSRTSVTPKYNINQISDDLNMINHAFNMVDNPDEYRPSLVSERGILNSPTLGLGSMDHNSELGGLDSLNLKTADIKRGISRPRIDKDEAQKIYNVYSERGNEVSLAPIHSPHDDFDWERDSLSYLCKINKIYFGKKLMRVICLEQYMVEAHGKETPHGDYDASPQGTGEEYEDEVIMEVQENKEESTHHFVEESVDFQEENEKEGGWIDFKSMQVDEPEPVSLLMSPVSNHVISFVESPGRLLSGFREQSTTLENGNLLSPMTSSFSVEKKEGSKKLLFKRLVRKHRTLAKFKKIIEYSSKSDSFMENQDNQKGYTPRTARTNVGSIASSSKVSSHTRILKAFKAALEVKHSPKLLRIVCILFYVFLVSIIFSLVYLKLTLDHSTETLNVKKDILTAAQLRSQTLASIEGILRPLSDLGTGRLVNEDFGLVQNSQAVYFIIARSYLVTLIATNEQIFTNAHLLEDDVRRNLFEKDVRIFGNEFVVSETEFVNVTSFQGTQTMIQTIFKMLAIAQVNVSKSVPQFEFFLRNGLNDLLVKNTEISETFLQSAKDEIDDIQFIIITYLIIAFIILGIVNFTLLLNVWKQYVREKNNMIAFTRLNLHEVKNVMNKINNFKRVLEKDGSFEDGQSTASIAEFAKPEPSSYKRITKEHVKTPRFAGITRKYLLYVRSWIVFLAFLIGVIMLSALTAQGYLSSFKDKLHQLDFINRMNTKVNMATLIFMELTVFNGQTLIENIPTEIGSKNVIQDIKNVRNELVDVIVNSDLVKVTKIKNTLFYNGCAELDPTSVLYCNILAVKGIESSFLQLITAFENFIVDRHNAFLASDRSPSSLKDIEVNGYDTLISLKRILTMEMAIISNTVSTKLGDYITNGNNQRTLVFVICSICLLILLCLVWVYILKRLSEADNQFKKVLRMLPGDLIFSSFLLKSFLMKTSQGLLNLTRDRL